MQVNDVWSFGDWQDIEASLREDIENGEFEMAKRKHNTATIILANGEEIHQVVRNVTGSIYQQGDIVRYGQKLPIYRDLGMNPFWFEDKELPISAEVK